MTETVRQGSTQSGNAAILAAVDGPLSGLALVRWAGRLAACLGAPLILLHAARPQEISRWLRRFAHEAANARETAARETVDGAGSPGPAAPHGGPLGDENLVMAGLPDWFHVAVEQIAAVDRGWEAREELAHAILDDAVVAAKLAGAGEVQAVVKAGDPLAAILAAAKESGAQLIVVGLHRGGAEGGLLQRLFQSGTAERLLADAGRPCLVVPLED